MQLRTNIEVVDGFVVSERLGGRNFADVFYRIYSHDLPVFVSADAKKSVTLPTFTNLTELDLSGNQLRELPAEIGNLTNLKMLKLSLSRDRELDLIGNHQKSVISPTSQC